MKDNKNIIWLSKGLPKTLAYKGASYRSGIAKTQAESLEVTFDRIKEDDVENHEYHGGADRVICVYPYEHYSFWEKTYGRELPQAAFGENLTITGMTEDTACIGDIFKIGSTIVQLSQGRFPCATVNKHTHIHTLLNKMIGHGFTGYFFRVLQEGIITCDSEVKLVEKHPMQISVATIHNTYFHTKDLKQIEAILSIEELSEEWKLRMQKLYNQLEKI